MANLLIANDNPLVAGVCTLLPTPHILALIISVPCPVLTLLHSRWYESGVNIALASTSTRITSCWFYGLLRKAPRSPSALPTAAPRVTIGCICSQL
jgi:hypothetical protein